MKTKFKSSIRATCHLFGGAVCAGAVMLISTSAQAQNLFVSDYANDTVGSGNIYEYMPSGVQSTFASGLSGPAGLAFNSAGDLFEADELSGNIYEFTPGGVQSAFASGLPNPNGLAFDSAGNLFVSCLGGQAGTQIIVKITPSGVQSTFASGLYYPYALAFNSAGDLFEADQNSGNIYEFTPGGTRSTFASGLYYPYALAFDSAGNLFECGLGGPNNYIYEFTPSGIKTIFSTATLSGSSGLAFNSTGNLFDVNPFYGNIFQFTPGGTRTTFASGLSSPSFIAFQGETLPVPEPSALALLAFGILGITLLRRHQG
jgi:hypothetical protein